MDALRLVLVQHDVEGHHPGLSHLGLQLVDDTPTRSSLALHLGIAPIVPRPRDKVLPLQGRLLVRPSADASPSVGRAELDLAIPNSESDLDLLTHETLHHPVLALAQVVRAADWHALRAAVADEPTLGERVEGVAVVIGTDHGEVLGGESAPHLRVAILLRLPSNGLEALARPVPDRVLVVPLELPLPRRVDGLQLVRISLYAELLMPHDAHAHGGLESAGLLTLDLLHLHGLPIAPRGDDVVPVPEGLQLPRQAHHVIILGSFPGNCLLPRLHVPLQRDLIDGALGLLLRAAVDDPVVTLRRHTRAQDDRLLVGHLAGREDLEVLVLVHADLELFHAGLAQRQREDVATGLLDELHLLRHGPTIE
mmetsp:Transcript_94841/g.283220  ORF Transcript_94841/g.283220 Transcript_94841/m.283220 type:complete len:366 (-) Transcript_94841:2766-3863(-)